jgi:hypothetical protein
MESKMTNQEKADKLRRAIELLEEVDVIQQEVLSDTDVCYENHNRIADLIEDFTVDVMELQ